ncbi:MAG TPA: lytic murein transglycosylase [Solirubrobacteraceae bacterium]|nr:lytic murein transglycosylase [Solirubrobacteraceae bacterium]
MAGVFGVAALPAASAGATCTVTVTLITGQVLYFQLPPGAPISSLNLTVPVKSVSESCPPAPSTPPPTTSTSTTTTPTPSTTSTTPSSPTPSSSHSRHSSGGSTSTSPSKSSTSSSSAPQSSGPGQAQAPSHHGSPPASGKPGQKKGGKPKPPSTPAPPPMVGPGGVPTPANPSFSFALPGPAPIGVPNFFIDSFRIPPFLLPIYQAAGIEYDVPWQVLAAINEIETDYGRNLSVSSAGAVGWMQFLPSTWKTYGVDANGDGVADPYNPVDAIFTAARYLQAAGASKNVGKAIFAYNHATWYVESVLLRAKLIGGLPGKLVDSITGLVQGHFPVAAPAKYADNAVLKLAKDKVKGSNAAVPIASDPASKVVHIFAAKGSPVIAVNDGKIVDIGHNSKLGRYIELQDATGNIYTYAQLGSIPHLYPVPKPVKVTAKEIAKELAIPAAPKPKGPASAGTQRAPAPPSKAKAKKLSAAPITLPVAPAPAAQPAAIAAPMVKERLFANPSRPASYAAGGALQVRESAPQLSNFHDYFSDVLHLAKNQYTLEPLRKGSIVVAGTILGRIGAGTKTLASHVDFMVRPAGKNAPYIDPKPILDGWKLLEATAVYRAAGVDPFFGPGAKNPTIGQILLMSKEQLEGRVLADPHVDIYACGRRDVQAGLIDRRVLATIEFLSGSGLYPTVSGLECGHSLSGSTGVDAAGATGSSMDISKINNIPVLGHQGPGSVTDLTIRRLLTLQGAMKPDEIVSLMSYKGQSNTLALPDHANRIQVAFTPLFGANKKLSAEMKDILRPGQWVQLINRISQIPEPIVPIAPSQYAIKVPRGG